MLLLLLPSRALLGSLLLLGLLGLVAGTDPAELLVEVVHKPEECVELSAQGDTLHVHYTGRLNDGSVFDTSAMRDPLQVELGKKQVIPDPVVLTSKVSLIQWFFLTWGGCTHALGCEMPFLGVRDMARFISKHKPEECVELSAQGDTLHVHYTGRLNDGSVFDTSAMRDPLQVELGKKQVIPGWEQGLLGMCVGEKRKLVIPPHLAYGKRGAPPSIPADAVLTFETELVSLRHKETWERALETALPFVYVGLVPGLLCLLAYYLYRKASTPRASRKKERKNKKK